MSYNDKKNIIWNSIGASLSAFSSLIFLIIVTRINGVFDAGIFTYSFATACLFYTISIYSTRSYQVTELNKSYSDSDFIFNRLSTCLIMFLVAIIFCIIKDYNLYKSSILLLLSLYKCIETMEETLYGIIQKQGLLINVGKSMTLRSILIYFVFFMIDVITKNVIVSIISIMIANLLVIFIYDLKILNKIKYTFTSFSNKKNVKLLQLGFNTFAFSFLSIYLLNASRYAIDNNLSETAQTIFGIIVMPGMVMSLLSQFIIQPFLLKITDCIDKKNFKRLKKVVNILLIAMTLIGIICIIIAFIIGIPILNIIYGIELNKYYFEFMIILVGSLFYGLSIIISNILIARRKTFIQVISLGTIALIAIFSSHYLVVNYNVLGACINYFIIMLMEFLLYILILNHYLKQSIKEAKKVEN